MSHPLHILVVDDDEGMLRTLVDILRMKGFQATPARSAEEARTIAERNGVDFVLCDVRMPDEDGVALYLSLKEHAPNLPFMLMTAYAEDELIRRGLKEGVLDVLPKPLDIERLLNLCRDLGRQRSLLLVDGDPTFREALGGGLRSRGYQVHETPDPAMAIEMLQEKDCGVLLLDLKLPGIRGVDLLRRLRERGLTCPVVLITAFAEDLQREIHEGLDLKAEGWLEKPFGLKEVEATLQGIRTKTVHGRLAEA